MTMDSAALARSLPDRAMFSIETEFDTRKDQAQITVSKRAQFGQAIKDGLAEKSERTGRRVRQRELAQALNVDDSTVNLWINRGIIPRDDKQVTSIADFFGWSKEKKQSFQKLAREASQESIQEFT